MPCDGGCAEPERCASLDGGCVTERAELCEPCSSDLDCGSPGDRCLATAEGSFCGRDCSVDGACPLDYLCRPAVTLDGGSAPSQCQPASGTCTCGAKNAGQTKPCEVKSPHGRSMGTRTCDGAKGWGACSAKPARPEMCNGKDDDCDGEIDEGLGESRCGVGECARVTPACVKGEAKRCMPGTPSADVCDQKDNDCDGKVDEDFNLQRDTQNCGACGVKCSFPNAVARCVAGKCEIDHCEPSYCDHDGQSGNGCEHGCDITNGGVEICDGIDNDCDGTVDEGFPVSSDPNNCGACGTQCSAPNAATYSCTMGRCGVLTCAPGRADCNGDFADGCEVDTTTSATDCGACGVACTSPNATAACTMGVCTMQGCNPGFADCDGLPLTGCETDTGSDLANCGACGNVCAAAGSTPSCSAGACGYACLPGFVDIDGSSANGCEYACTATGAETCDGLDNDCDGAIDEGFDLTSDPSNCGTCANACTAPQAASYTCTMSTCGLASCTPGFADCDGFYATGCEVDTGTSPANCGACGNVCLLSNATPVCRAGQCGVGSCATGFGDCDGLEATGCETDTTTDLANCGACGNVCSFPNAAPSCAAGACAYSCLPGFVDLDGSGANGCEYACLATGAEVCDGRDNDCDGAVDEGFDLATDTGNCGACGNACAAPRVSTQVCSMGTCSIGACSAGFSDCNGLYADGCETNTSSSVTSCGGCGVVCSTPNATPRCSAGSCGIQVCNQGFRDCNSVAADGCEVSTATDRNNCGQCGRACSATTTCINGMCR